MSSRLTFRSEKPFACSLTDEICLGRAILRSNDIFWFCLFFSVIQLVLKWQKSNDVSPLLVQIGLKGIPISRHLTCVPAILCPFIRKVLTPIDRNCAARSLNSRIHHIKFVNSTSQRNFYFRYNWSIFMFSPNDKCTSVCAQNCVIKRFLVT